MIDYKRVAWPCAFEGICRNDSMSPLGVTTVTTPLINQCLFIWGWHSSECFSFDPGLRWRFLLTGVFIFAAVITVDVLILHMTKCSQRYKPACELVRLYFLHRCFHNCHDFFCKASRTRRVAINAWIGLEENFRLNLPFFVPETVGKPPIFPIINYS